MKFAKNEEIYILYEKNLATDRSVFTLNKYYRRNEIVYMNPKEQNNIKQFDKFSIVVLRNGTFLNLDGRAIDIKSTNSTTRWIELVKFTLDLHRDYRLTVEAESVTFTMWGQKLFFPIQNLVSISALKTIESLSVSENKKFKRLEKKLNKAL